MAEKTFKNIKKLLEVLYCNRDLLYNLFEHRNSMTYSDAVIMCEGKGENIELLLDYEILERNDEYIEISSFHRQYFENVIDCGEFVDIGQTDHYLKEIKNSIDIVMISENRNNIRENQTIRKRINDINAATKKESIVLRRKIQETYTTEKNIMVKLEKLKQLEETLMANRDCVNRCHDFFDDNETFFSSVINDVRINSAIMSLRDMLLEVGSSFISIEQTLRQYIAIIEHKNISIKKARKLVSLCREHKILENTNIKELATRMCPLWIENKKRWSILPSLEQLSDTDTVENIIFRVNEKFHGIRQRRKIGRIPPEFMVTKTEEVNEIPYEAIYNSFTATNENLFEYIQKYKFDFDVSYDEKVDCFLNICITHYDQLTHDHGLYKSNDKSYYPIIINKM